MKIIAREELERIPCDKRFSYNGNEVLAFAVRGSVIEVLLWKKE